MPAAVKVLIEHQLHQTLGGVGTIAKLGGRIFGNARDDFLNFCAVKWRTALGGVFRH